VKIVSWNLLHRSGATLDEVMLMIREQQPDLLVMQEATSRIDVLPDRIGGHYARNPLPGRVHGLATWSREPFLEPPTVLKLQRGLVVDRVCQIVDLGAFAVANVHLSHGQFLNRRQLRRIGDALTARAAVIGDCNLLGRPRLPGFRDVGPRLGTFSLGGLMPVRPDRCFVRGLTCDRAEILPGGSSDHRPIAVWLSVPLEARA